MWDDDYDELVDHHPPCRGGCGQLADECMCNWTWPPPKQEQKEQKNGEAHPEEG